ncbi:MAG: MBL fold metallo-hydrolase [Oscillospiraceae bacterium]|nr:MBL fold metallo-hydrolase [Oscillospiraceae bacterium]
MNNGNEFLDRISVNTHSSVRIETNGHVLYIDPFALTRPTGDADVIFLTHPHFDHFSPQDLVLICKSDTIFVLPERMADQAAEMTKGHRVIAVAPFAHGEVEGIAFETIPAYNAHKPFHPRKNNWVGYVLTLEGLRIYIAGDTDATEEAAAVSCDIAMIPIGGKYTMDAKKAAVLTNRMHPQIVIPIHYGSVAGSMEDFNIFAEKVDPSITVHRVI